MDEHVRGRTGAVGHPGTVDVSPALGASVACGSFVFRHRGQLRVVVIAKATFSIVPDGVAAAAKPTAILSEDLVPYRPRVDITFAGHAYAPGGAAGAAAVRLAVFRERAVVDKTIHVFGDREGALEPGAPRPFDRMPIVYERARASAGDLGADNPVGTTGAPNLVDPRDPSRPAGFGAIPRVWPSRARLLGALDRRALEAPIAEIPDDFDWRYFQGAPPDQQIDALRGDEWIVLDGLHPTSSRVQTRLPSPAISARVHGVAASADGGGEALALVADTLAIDGDRQACDIVWRGFVAIPEGESALARVRILVGLHVPSQAAIEPSAPPADAADVTLAFSMPAPLAAPFLLAKAGSTRPAAPEIAGAPWSAAPAPPVPKMIDALAQTVLPVTSPFAARGPASPVSPPEDRERPPVKRLPPALPLKGTIYGKPKARKTR